MNIASILGIAFALALDAFAVSVAAAAYSGGLGGRQKFRLSFHFGLFQFYMPLLGWLAGSTIVRYVSQYDHWIAFAILAVIGIKMIADGRHPEISQISKDITRGWALVTLSVATSIDALAVGFSIGIIKDHIFFPAIII
ncbi:manganese efflux pump, partial [candidate division KSB1 bacterium]|nr:manganese efflux pump [candidate division KSB1 bacterium]